MNANKDVLLVKPQNSVVSKEFLALPLTLPIIHASYPRAGSSLAIPLLTFPHQVPQKKAGAKDTPNTDPRILWACQTCTLAFWSHAWKKAQMGRG